MYSFTSLRSCPIKNLRLFNLLLSLSNIDADAEKTKIGVDIHDEFGNVIGVGG